MPTTLTYIWTLVILMYIRTIMYKPFHSTLRVDYVDDYYLFNPKYHIQSWWKVKKSVGTILFVQNLGWVGTGKKLDFILVTSVTIKRRRKCVSVLL